MTTDIAVIGPMGHDECAHHLADGLTQAGATVRAIDPLRVREVIAATLHMQGVNEHYAMRKPLSLKWLAEHATSTCDIRGCSIIVITDQPIEYVNDLEPLDDLGNRPIVVYHRNEYNQPPSCMNPTIIAFGQPQMQAMFLALWPWAASNIRRAFDLPTAGFPDRVPFVPMDIKGTKRVIWPNDNFHGRTYNAFRITRWHSMSNDLWCSLDDAITAACKHGVQFIEGDADITRDEYLKLVADARAELIVFPFHVYNGRRLWECCASGTVPIIQVQVERFGYDDPNDYSYRNDKFYSHEKFLAQLGFRDGVNCLMYRDPAQLDYLCKLVEDDANIPLLQRIARSARELVESRHTYLHRAKQILTEIGLYNSILGARRVEEETGIGLPYTRKEIEL